MQDGLPKEQHANKLVFQQAHRASNDGNEQGPPATSKHDGENSSGRTESQEEGKEIFS